MPSSSACCPLTPPPYYTDEKLAQGNAVLAAICEHYGMSYVDLRDCGITAADLPDGIHPGEKGMDLISNAVLSLLEADCRLEPGEHTVHPVTHTLSGAVSSKGHIKGISHGQPFAAAITGKDLAVTVTMDGTDLTETCYTGGIISIEAVTGELVITATGTPVAEHDGYLQPLPESLCSKTNLWPRLEPSLEYYTVDGWGTHSSGKVRSVTIPVTPGDRLYATSFGPAGSNGSTMNGIRVTWFGSEKMLRSRGASEVYTEFAENGCLTAPDGAVAVCIPFWTADDSNELYLLGLDHTYENGICTGCGAEYPGIQILTQPVPFDAAIGEKATVQVEALGEDLRYQWYYRDAGSQDFTKSTVRKSTYTLTVKPINVNRELYCVITDAHGNQVTTDTVNLLKPLSQELKIIRQPQPASAAIGEVTTVSMEVQGEGLRYQWYYRDLPDGSLTRSSITDSSYRVTVTAFNAQRVLYCVITDGHGNKVTTDTVPLRTDRALPTYYASLSDALTDTNASTSPEGAVAEVTRESGSTTVKLLQDTTLTEPLTLSAAVTLDLNGHTVSSAIFPMLRVEAEGCTIQNGSMKLSHEGTAAAEVVAISVASGAALDVSQSTVTVTDSANSTVVGILTEAGSTLVVTESDITVTTGKSLSNAGVRARGKAILRDCTVIAEADYTGANGAYTSNSASIYAYAELELYDCYVWGAHSGVSAKGKVYVNGGTYEGYGHGGFYLSASGETAYFCNAAFNWAEMRPGTVADSVAGTNNSAFYLGSASNITAYFDNCSFKSNKASKSYCLTLRSSGGESNNAVYVSNSTFTGYQRYAYRLGNDKSTNNLLAYSGVGNSYGIRVFNNTAKGTYTEDSYAQIIADNTPIS